MPVDVQLNRGRSQLFGSIVPSCGSSRQGPPLAAGVPPNACAAPDGTVLVPSGPNGPPAKSVQPPEQPGDPELPPVPVPRDPPNPIAVVPPVPCAVDPPAPRAAGPALPPEQASKRHAGKKSRANERIRFIWLALAS